MIKTPALFVLGMALGLAVVSYRLMTGDAPLWQIGAFWPVVVGGLLGLVAGAYLDGRGAHRRRR